MSLLSRVKSDKESWGIEHLGCGPKCALTPTCFAPASSLQLAIPSAGILDGYCQLYCVLRAEETPIHYQDPRAEALRVLLNVIIADSYRRVQVL